MPQMRGTDCEAAARTSFRTRPPPEHIRERWASVNGGGGGVVTRIQSAHVHDGGRPPTESDAFRHSHVYKQIAARPDPKTHLIIKNNINIIS